MCDPIEINDKVVYVRGASRGAVYNFKNGNVYSINEEACEALEKYISSGSLSGEFLQGLHEMSLIGDAHVPVRYFCKQKTKKLEFVWLELTEACNLRCSHCYIGDAHRDDPKESLSLEQWKNVIRQLRDAKCEKIEFIGGEPTIYPYFEELLCFAVSIGQDVDVYSNLQAFNDRILNFVMEHDVVIHFSIYGSVAATHDSITQRKGSFDTLMCWLKRLLENKVRVIPSITIMRQNQDDIDRTVALLESMGIPTARMSIDTVRATSRRGILGMEIDEAHKDKVLRWKPNFQASENLFCRSSHANTCLCGKFSIHPDGLVSPCEFSRDIVYGNVKDQSIAEILDSDMLNRFWFLDYSKIEPCKDCEYRFSCQDCRMLLGRGGLYKKNPRCLYNPKTGIWDCPHKH